MTINPYEPPRAPEDGAAALPVTGTGDEVSDTVIDELVKSAPWARWAGYLFVVATAGSVLESVVAVVRARQNAHLGTAIGGAAISIPMAALFLWVSRRYSTNAARLPASGRGALSEVIASQRRLFTGLGVILLLVSGLIVLAIGAGLTMSWVMRR